MSSSSFSSPSPGIVTRSSSISSSPSVIAADKNRMVQSYSYGGNNNSSSGWFSGLRSKISGMSEWLSQLGVPSSPNTQSTIHKSNTHQMIMEEKEKNGPGEGYDSFTFQSIQLDDCAMSELNPLGWMDLDTPQSWNDTLEKQHFGPLRDLLTIGGTKRGKGHDFEVINLLHPTWCDKCGDFIWGFMQQASKCSKCKYTCHERCLPLITLDCRSSSSSLKSEDAFYPNLEDGTLGTIPQTARIAMRSHESASSVPLPDIPSLSSASGETDKENKTTSVHNPLFQLKNPSSTVPRSFAPSMNTRQREPSAPPIEELDVKEIYVKEDTPCEWAPGYKDSQLVKKIEEYNKIVDQGMELTLSPSGDSFTGSLHIHMNFSRPINVVAGEKPPTVYDVVNTGKSTTSLRTITSFFLPRNTVKTVTLNSEMSTRQMVVALLRKFKVADNPKKFALYECTQQMQSVNTLLRKLVRVNDDACPLKTVLNWDNPREKCFVLQENDTGDIVWDAFEIPELENFLRILKMEEEQYRSQCKEKYRLYERNLDCEIRAKEDEIPEEEAPRTPKHYSVSPSTSSSSLIHNGTMRPFSTAKTYQDEDHVYVNIAQLGDSTRL